MKKVDINQKVKAFNQARVDNQKRVFTSEELYTTLKKVGIPRDIVDKLNKYNYFERESIDGKTAYSFKVTPLHHDTLEAIYNEKRKAKRDWIASKKDPSFKASNKKEVSEEDLILSLKAMGGYRICKNVGIDTDRIKREDPELYATLVKKYTKWIVI